MNRCEEAYLRGCDELEAVAQKTIGRSLTTVERQGIHNAGSLMMLEAVGRSVESERNGNALAAKLVDMGRSFNDRLEDQLSKICARLSELMGYRFSDAERKIMLATPLATDMRRLVTNLEQLDHPERSKIMREYLGSL